METNSFKNRITDKTTSILLLIVVVILLGISAYLFINSIAISYDAPTGYYVNEMRSLVRDNWIIHLIVICIACAILFWGNRLFSKIRDAKQEIISLIILVITAVICITISIIYVCVSPYYPTGDQMCVGGAAYYFRQGEFSMLSKAGYMGIYRFQEGLVWLYEIVFAVFGDLNYKAIEIINAVYVMLTLIAGWSFLRVSGSSPFSRMVFCILYMGCCPLFIYIPFVYGDIPSIFWAMLMILMLALLEKHQKIPFWIVASICAVMAILNRGNSWIIIIAVCIVCVLYAIKNHKPIALAVGASLVILPLIVNASINKYNDVRSGYDSDGAPMILWVAMGMQETEFMPGTYNHYQQDVLGSVGFDSEKAKEVAWEYINNRIGEFCEYPDYTYYFYSVKAKSQWLEPTFESFRLTHSFNGQSISDEFQNFYAGELHDKIWRFSNYYQSIVYAGFLCFVVYIVYIQIRTLIKKNKDANNTKIMTCWIFPITVIGGFIFSLIWENQSRYVLPYYIFIILCFSYGIGMFSGKKQSNR